MVTDAELLALMLSLKVSLAAIMVGLPLSLALAWLLARKDFRGKTVLDMLIHAPLVLPPVVVGYLLLVTFSPGSAVGGFLQDAIGFTPAFRWQGASIAALVMALPLMVRAIRLSLEAQNPRLAMAARTLGAGRLRTFLQVTLPLALPGIIAGGLLGFARAFGEFGATITFVSNIPGMTQTLPLALYSAVQQPGGEAAALRILILSLVVAFAALGVSEYLARRMRRKIRGEA